MRPKTLTHLLLIFTFAFLSLARSDGITKVVESAPVAALPAPQMRGPYNGTQLQSMGPTTLNWANPAGTAQYQIQVTPYNDDGPGINLIIGDTARVRSGSFLVEPPEFGVGMYVLLPDMTYTWRVRVTDATVSVGEDHGSWGPWSEGWTFHTPPPPKFNYGNEGWSPRTDAFLDSASAATLRWPTVDRTIFYYELQVSTDPLFRTGSDAVAAVWWMLIHGGESNPPNSWTTPGLDPGRVYHWRVRPRVQGDGTAATWAAQCVGCSKPLQWRFFAPDIPNIAFWSNRTDYNYGAVFLMNSDGSGVTPRTMEGHTGFTRDPGNSPDWALDGNRLVTVRDGRFSESGDALVIIEANGTIIELVNAPAHDRAPAWSPDGSVIAFHSETDRSDIYTIRPDGTGLTNLTNNPAGVYAKTPSWSPDATKLAFELWDSLAHTINIYVMNADGTGQRNLTDNPAYPPVGPLSIEAHTPAWSPNGTKIAFQERVFPPGQSDIFIVNSSDGSGKTRLSYGGGAEPAWSPDGSKIAFFGSWEGNSEIYIISSDGSGGPVNVTNNPANDTSPAWSRR